MNPKQEGNMLRYLIGVTVAIVAATVIAVPLVTQAQMPGPSAGVPKSYEVQGTVGKVNAGAGTVKVSTGLFGLLGPTIQVTSDTQIQVEGRQATLADIKPGAKVKAAYEIREGRNIAMRIDQVPAGGSEKLQP